MVRVKFFPLQAHSLAFGGFEIQMLTLLENLQLHCKNEIVTSKIDVWSRDQDFDIAHFWGLEVGNYNNILWAKKSGKKVVVTVLLSYYERWLSIIYDKISRYVGYKKFQMEILKLVDSVIVVNDLQKSIAQQKFKISPEKVFVIPNIVHENYRQEPSSYKNDGSYVLCTGNICARKNQINLTKACVIADVELILVGRILPGEEKYAYELEKIVEKSDKIKWIKGLPENSPELIELVKNCRIFALLSKSETQPISILEAISVGKQIILSDRRYSFQEYFINAMKVNPDNVSDIVVGIKNVFNDEYGFRADSVFLTDFQGKAVANKYLQVYKSIL